MLETEEQTASTQDRQTHRTEYRQANSHELQMNGRHGEEGKVEISNLDSLLVKLMQEETRDSIPQCDPPTHFGVSEVICNAFN